MSLNGIIVIVCSLILTVSSFSIRVRKQTYVPDFQPKNIAFSIWSVIFSLSLVSGIRMLYHEMSIVPGILFSVSCILCSLWLILQKYKFSFVILYSACLLAVISTCINKDFISVMGPALLSGWLLVASALGTAIYVTRVPEVDVNKYNIVIPFACMAIFSSIVSSNIGNKFSGLFIAAPLLWTSILSKSTENAVLFGLPYTLITAFLIGQYSVCWYIS